MNPSCVRLWDRRELRPPKFRTRIGAMNPTQSHVAAEVTRYTLSLAKGSDLCPGERAGVE